MGAVGWEQAWQQALYGLTGFYRGPDGPSAHFTTATHGPPGTVLAGAFARLARELGLTHIVDVGAGSGELLSKLYAADPALRLTGVEVATRPAGVPDLVTWLVSDGGSSLPDQLQGLKKALVVAHEWLDVVPCSIAEVDGQGTLRHRLVEPATGAESWGPPVDGEELAWATAHWPTSAPGERVEIGLTRDRSWAGLLARVDNGVAVAVDYGHRGGERPANGTLTAYRHGREVTPVADGTCDLTAHVAMDTLDHDDLLDQRTVLRGLGLAGETPPHDLARRDPAAYLRALERASAAAVLTRRGGFGDFLWAVKRLG